MNMIIDDYRNLGCDIIVRNPEIGMELLLILGKGLEYLCIDHDLGFETTGFDVIKFGIEKNCLPNKVQIVSMNPVGKQNIANVLLDNNYNTVDNINFVKEIII